MAEGGPFDLFTVEMPLSRTAWSPKSEARSPQKHYPTIEPPSLIRLLRPMLAAVMVKHCIGAWWVYGPRFRSRALTTIAPLAEEATAA